MYLGVSIKNTTKGFCEILPGTDQARHIKFFFRVIFHMLLQNLFAKIRPVELNLVNVMYC